MFRMTNTNQTNTIKIDPKCRRVNPVHAYSATGHMLPCCYADNANLSDFDAILTDNLLVDNVENVNKDIVNSNEWRLFFEMLEKNPESAQRACKFYCTQEWITKNTIRV